MFRIKKRKEQLNNLDNNSFKLTDYNTYTLSDRQYLFYLFLAAAAIFAIGFVFYHSALISLFLCPFALFYPNIKKRSIIEKRKNNLNLQFRDLLYSLSSSLSAGKSVEHSFRYVLNDLSVLYPDPDTDIIKEVEYLIRKIEMNETIEAALENFASRSHIEDIINFSDVLNTCKRTGGNIISVIKNSSNIINDKIEIKNEIDTLLAARKFEQKILNIMPIFMVIILTLSAGDYMEPIFTKLAGRLTMTISIGFLTVAYIISKKIMNIKV